MFEVDYLGTLVWEYVNPGPFAPTGTVQGTNITNNDVFRAYRYAPDFPTLKENPGPAGPVGTQSAAVRLCVDLWQSVSSSRPEELSGVRVLSNPGGIVLVENETERACVYRF